VRDLLRQVSEQGEEEPKAQFKPLENPEAALSEKQKRWLRELSLPAKAVARLLYSINRVLVRMFFRLKVSGLDNLPARTFVFTPNHVSYLDAFVLAAALDYEKLRRTYWGGWTGAAFANPLARAFSRLARVVPVDPESGALSSLIFGAAVLKGEKDLIWFPEGERSPDGKLQSFKPGIGLLLDRFEIEAVPVWIEGTFQALPRGRVLPRPFPVKIIFGTPLRPEELRTHGAGERPEDRIAQALHDAVAELGKNLPSY
jgi:long-chain acyl-CoA synthetase